jgi:WD40 repeat protein
LWDVSSETIVGELSPNPAIESLAFSDDGQTIVTGGLGGVIRLWSVPERELRHTYDSVFWGLIGDLEFVKGTPILAILASDRELHLYDIEDRREIRSFRIHILAGGLLARSHNGKFLAIASGDGSIKILRVADLTRPNVFWHDAHVRGVDFLPDGTRVVAASGDGAMRIWDIQTGESQLLADASGRQITTISAQRQGHLIAVAGVAPRVALWDWQSGKLVHEIGVAEGRIAAVAFSASGRQLAVGTRLGGSFVYESEDWTKPRFEVPAREAGVCALAFSADDRHIAIGYEDGAVHLIDPASGARRGQSADVATIPLALAFCESGNLLAIGTDAGEIHLYDVAARRTRQIIKAHTSRINALATLPGGTTLVSGGRDKELRLWDIASGELLTTLFGHRRQVFSIAVSPDGQTIASGGLEGDVRIWSARRSR